MLSFPEPKKKRLEQIINNEKRIFYVTPLGEVHFAMPTRDYVEYCEKRLWVWYLIPIKPTYEK